MRGPAGGALAVACLVVLAGCSLPFGTSPSPTPTAEPADPEPYPPGVSSEGVENATTLYRAHVDAITATGYSAVGAVNTTVLRSGFLLAVRSEAQVRVEPNASRYHERRLIAGGPVERREEYWSNGSVEFYRVDEGGEPEHERREPRSPRRIAGRELLLPFLAGGDFAVESVNETAEARTVTLVATSMADPEAVRPALPAAADSIGSFEARVVVDGERIRSLVADVGFGIDGTNRTHHVEYELVSTEDVAVERPDWVEDARRQTETASAGLGVVSRVGRLDGRDGSWSTPRRESRSAPRRNPDDAWTTTGSG